MNIQKTPSLSGGQMLTIAYFIGILVILFVVYKTLKGLGLIKDLKKDAAVEDIRTSDYFNPDYYKDKSFQHLGEQAGELHAKELFNAMNGFGTDEEAIYAVFGKLYNKLNVSELSDYYRQQNAHWYNFDLGKDLQTDLLNELNDTEKQTLWAIIEKLPNK
jgi:hypothetical protein